MRPLVSLIISLLISTLCYGSHIAGGSIMWEKVPNNQWVFTLEIIRDCAGASIPTSAQTISGPNGNIVLNYSPTLSGFINLGNCNTFSCANGSGFERGIYRSSPITLSGTIPATGWEFAWSTCCFSSMENTSSSNVYISSTMYPNINGGIPASSTAHYSVSALAFNGVGPKSFNLGAQLYGNVDSVKSILTSPFVGANAPLAWSQGYSAQNPLPDQSESPLNGPFYYSPQTGIASTDINDLGALSKRYILGVDHLFYSNGALVGRVKKTIPFFTGPNTTSTPAPIVNAQVGNSAVTPYQRGMAPPRYTAILGQPFTLTFNALDMGDTLLAEVQSILTNPNRGANMGWSNYSNLNVSYPNSPQAVNLVQAQISITPTADNAKEGPSLVNFRVQDFSCPNNEINMPIELIFEPSVGIQKTSFGDTLALCPPFTDSIRASQFNNGAYWTPGSLVSDSTASAVSYSGSTNAWLYLKDTLNTGNVDSVYIRRVVGSVSIAKGNGNLQLFDSVGLSNYTWRLNGVDFLTNTATLTNPANGVYDLYGSSQGCIFTTDTLQVGSGNGFAISPVGSGVLSPKQKLNGVYGLQFSVANGNLVTETFRLNQVYLYGISSTFNKNAFSQATLKLFDNNKTEIYSGTLALQPNSPSVVYLPQVNLNEGQNYFLTLSGDTNAYYSMYQTPSVPYQLGSLASQSGLLEVKSVYMGNNPNTVPNTMANEMPAFALKFSSTIGEEENKASSLRVYPNPVKNWLRISFEANAEKQFTIYNLQGQKIIALSLNTGNKKIDVSELPTGVYILQSERQQIKFMKN